MWLFNNKTGLVLGGGGVRGFFHLGVIKAIQEKGIKIDRIAGTSIGAVVGVMYATNPQIDVEKLAAEFDFLGILKMMAFGDRNIDGKGLEAVLKKFVGVNCFEELKIPLAFNTTDINERKQKVFERGNLFPGLTAAVSIPGVFAPVGVDGNYLIDGGVVNNVPVSLVGSCRKIIVSDITGPIKKVGDKSSRMEVLMSAVGLMQYQKSREEITKMGNKEIRHLHLKDEQTQILDFRKENYKKLMDEGYREALGNLR